MVVVNFYFSASFHSGDFTIQGFLTFDPAIHLFLCFYVVYVSYPFTITAEQQHGG